MTLLYKCIDMHQNVKLMTAFSQNLKKMSCIKIFKKLPIIRQLFLRRRKHTKLIKCTETY